ncbi:hypothetical protein [Salinisphaera hydrothermalis]|uniref:hypothetical protein n=1 Tax=Salinisphaera hydrothermalis TaxID=563188 RepID=UPI0012EB4A92|nr:hypothetical protein [Salinisphaera hydrothermalis]
MARNIKQIEQKLNTLSNEEAKLKAQLKAKKQAERNKQRKIDRRKRNYRAYECGGLVEKMGLFNLPNEELISLLWLAHKSYEKYDAEKIKTLKQSASHYFEDGKKLKQLEPKKAEE